uniref:C2H2-type domain-containing protein n=2 Tax=Caenorhabditis japonica TaxID=281687 RepID=A0A8R1HQQ2_CAEJA
MTLICPMCSETLEEEGSHFYKHFKYKRYACGETSCVSEFYTEAERNSHCTKHGHKRSFQKTVNPYIDKVIADIIFDAKELATKDMETVIENRWGNQEIRLLPTRKSATSTPSIENSEPATSSAKKKRSLIVSTPTSAKKSKNLVVSSEVPGTPIIHRTSLGNEEALCRSDANSNEVDSTTIDQPSSNITEKTKKSRKKRAESDRQETSSCGDQTYDKMSALDKLIGWFDPNVPERQAAAKVECAVCKEQIVYDFILRRSHVMGKHMAADTHLDDYDDLLKTLMDLSFPDLPNSNLACQLCMTGTDIRKGSRREHIENLHTTSLPPLSCPIFGCTRGFRRQCEMSIHMKETHKKQMSNYKDTDFQQSRRRRNFMINEMINKCFPWSKLERYDQVATSSGPTPSATPSTSEKVTHSATADVGFKTDVRVLDVNKTRRAPVYNHNDSESSDSETEARHETNDEEEGGIENDKSAADDFSDDVIYIGNHFNSEVLNLLSQRNACITVKPEVVDVDVDVDDVEAVNVDDKKEDKLKEEEPDEKNLHESSAPRPNQIAAVSPNPSTPTEMSEMLRTTDDQYNQQSPSPFRSSKPRGHDRSNHHNRWDNEDRRNWRPSASSRNRKNSSGNYHNDRTSSSSSSTLNSNSNSNSWRRPPYSRSSYSRGNSNSRNSRWS